MGLEEINNKERQTVRITALREHIKKLLNNGNKVLWSLQPEIESNDLLNKLNEQDIRLEELKFAVFSSEVAYNLEMSELVNLAKKSITWIDPLPMYARRMIASTTERVKRASDIFLGHLEEEWAQSRTITMEKIYETLLEMIPQFQNYVTYCMHQEELRLVIQTAMFKKESLLKASFSERMNVERVLLPLQRLQTLRLLLQEIRHELIPTTHSSENNSCKNALYKLTEFLDECYKVLAVLHGPEYTNNLNDELESNAYRYGLGIAFKAENGNGRIDDIITLHDNLQDNYIPPRLTRHASLLPTSKKQDKSVEYNRHSYEGFSQPEVHTLNTGNCVPESNTLQDCSTIQDNKKQMVINENICQTKSAKVNQMTNIAPLKNGQYFLITKFDWLKNSSLLSTVEGSNIKMENDSAIHEECLQMNASPALKDLSCNERCTLQMEDNNKIHGKQMRDDSSVSLDSGISCDICANTLPPAEHFNEISNYQLSNLYFSYGLAMDANKLHANECNNNDCVFCQNNINECYNYILIGEIEHSFQCNRNVNHKNQNYKSEAYNNNKDTNKNHENVIPTILLQQFLIGSPKLLSTINKQQMYNQEVTAFSKMHKESLETKISHDIILNAMENTEKDLHILERNNNAPKIPNLVNHEEDLIKFPDSYKETLQPKNVYDICFNPIKRSDNMCWTKKLENEAGKGNHLISKPIDKIPGLCINDKFIATLKQNNASSGQSNYENSNVNEQNTIPEDHIYAEPIYYSASTSKNSRLHNETCNDASTEICVLPVNNETQNIYDVPIGDEVMPTQTFSYSYVTGEYYEGLSKSSLSLDLLSASLTEDNISRNTLLTACVDVPLYQIFNFQKEKFPYNEIEDIYIEPESHIYEDIDTIATEKPEYDKPTGIKISRPTEQYQRLRWIETCEVINSRLTDKLNSTEIALQEAKFEIITSEVSYFKSLCILETIFMDSPLLEDKSILPQKDYELLFSTIQKVKECSQQFLAELTASWQEDFMLNNLCKVVSKFVLSGALQVYVDNCVNQIYIGETLQHLRKTNPTFTNILARLEAEPVCQLFSLQSFLTLPMQRVTRLPLLIQAILRHLPAGHAEYKTWKTALTALYEVVNNCNDAAGEAEQIRLNKRLISPAITQHSAEKKKAHFWKKFRSKKNKV